MAEPHDSLWQLAASPLVWALHFALCYATAAIYCAKVAGPDGSLAGARVAILVYTVLGLAAVAAIGRRGLRAARAGEGPALPYDSDSTEGRHRFMGFATLLLSGLSAVAIVYETLPVLFIGSCR
jgi:hypothetical protein